MVELQIAAAEEIPLVKMVLREPCATQPAPLVLALGTGHVVAALVGNLCDPCLAHFAVYHVAFRLCPLSVVQVFCVIAGQAFVVGPPADEANLCLTFGTDFRGLANGGAAVWRRTPF